MKRLIFCLFILINALSFAQMQDNRFSRSEGIAQMSEAPAETEQGSQPTQALGGEPGNPGAPIDDYVPLLAIVAVGIIVYSTYRKKSAL